jgi:hypothetical protein
MREARIDEAVLALLYLGHWIERQNKVARAWKSFDWSAMERLHDKGLISNPVGKSKCVVLSDQGLSQAKRAHDALFGSDLPSRAAD